MMKEKIDPDRRASRDQPRDVHRPRADLSWQYPASEHHTPSERRKILLTAGEAFVRRIIRVRGVERVALVGSLTTEKINPKDIDFLITVSDDFDIEAAAEVGRKLKGGLQGHKSGADIFLCDTNFRYIGRTCSYRECHLRGGCQGNDCRPSSWLNTDFHLVKIKPELCENPPVIIWPTQRIAGTIPPDVEQMLANLESLCVD